MAVRHLPGRLGAGNRDRWTLVGPVGAAGADPRRTALFGVGLLVAGTATAMPQLLVGRVLQGLGAGALAVATFVVIAAVYPERVRPAVSG